MRRALSIIALVLTGAAFILLCLIWVLRINAIIPVLMFAAAIILLGICKKCLSNLKPALTNHKSAMMLF